MKKVKQKSDEEIISILNEIERLNIPLTDAALKYNVKFNSLTRWRIKFAGEIFQPSLIIQRKMVNEMQVEVNEIKAKQLKLESKLKQLKNSLGF